MLRLHVGQGRPIRVSLVRDGESWLIIGVDDLNTCRVRRAAISTCDVLVTMFSPTVPQWVLDQGTADQDVLGEGEDVYAREAVPGSFDLEHELPTEVRIRCGYPGWHDDYEGGPFLVSHNASTFRTPVPRYTAKSFPYRATWVRNEFGAWQQLERGVRWESLDDPKAPIPDGVRMYSQHGVPK